MGIQQEPGFRIDWPLVIFVVANYTERVPALKLSYICLTSRNVWLLARRVV